MLRLRPGYESHDLTTGRRTTANGHPANTGRWTRHTSTWRQRKTPEEFLSVLMMSVPFGLFGFVSWLHAELFDNCVPPRWHTRKRVANTNMTPETNPQSVCFSVLVRQCEHFAGILTASSRCPACACTTTPRDTARHRTTPHDIARQRTTPQ